MSTEPSSQDTFDAGRFAAWRDAIVAELSAPARERRGVDVPCGTCDACCRSSMFVHIEPDEVETLRRVPRELLFAAPGAPEGHVVMGYDEEGRCPMLGAGGCTIYEHRPRTCRTFDCRVFAACDVAVDAGKPLVAARVAAWRFAVEDETDARARRDLAAAVDRLRLEGLDGLRLALAALSSAAPRETAHRPT